MPKILIVDDEESIRRVLSRLLRNEGYEVIEAINGREGVEYANRENPDVIIMDLQMPELDGIAACKKLKEAEKTRNIPVLVITTVTGQGKMDAINAGVDDFVNKPFLSEEVSIRVKSMLKIGGLRNELERVTTYMKNTEEERKVNRAKKPVE